jgi:hypothetical protein
MSHHHHMPGGYTEDHTGVTCPNDPCDCDEYYRRAVGRSGEGGDR